MQIKSLELILEEANKQIKRLSFDESIDLIKNHSTLIIDVREESEVHSSGVIKNAIHIPRGLIEFKYQIFLQLLMKMQIYLYIVQGVIDPHLPQKHLKILGLKMYLILAVMKNGF